METNKYMRPIRLISPIRPISPIGRISISRIGLISAAALAVFAFPLFSRAAVTQKGAPTKGLVGYWSFNEGTSTIANDYSGNGNNGTLSGTTIPTWTNGKLGKALSFNVTSSYVNIPDAAMLRPNGSSWTVVAWAKPPATDQTTVIVSKRQNSGNFTQFSMGICGDSTGCGVSGKKLFGIYRDSTAVSRVSGSTANIADGRWHLLVMMADSSAGSVRLFSDGVELSKGTNNSGAWPTVSTSDPVRIGDGNGSLNFSGPIDEVRIYNRALSAAEITALYQSGAEKYQAPTNTGLVGYWSFNEGTSTIANDYSGNGNNGTLSGTTIPVWTNGKLGKALSFDGSTSVVNAGAGAKLGDLASISTCAWINYRANLGNITAKGGLTWAFDLASNGTLFFRQYFNAGSTAFAGWATSAVVSGNKWVYVCATFDRTNVSNTPSFYINGILQSSSQTDGSGTATTFTSDAALPFYIGGIPGSAENYPYNGLIDEVRVYNRVLSAADVATLYKSGAAKYTPPNNKGLVGYWSFNEGTSTIANDYSGNGNNGTLVSSPTWKNGKFGKALDFTDGPYVSVPHAANQLLTSGFTISAWIKPRSTGSGQVSRVVEKAADVLGTGGYTYRMSGSTSPVAMRLVVNNGGAVDSAASIPFNRWTHIAVTVTSGGTVTHYINGVKSGTAGATGATSGITTTNALLIGQSVAGARGFDGVIDEVRVYNRTLSAQEVLNLYNSF